MILLTTTPSRLTLCLTSEGEERQQIEPIQVKMMSFVVGKLMLLLVMMTTKTENIPLAGNRVVGLL